jgi:hypothetical protein
MPREGFARSVLEVGILPVLNMVSCTEVDEPEVEV